MASIMKQGTIGRLAGPEMISVHGVWPSLFSGVSVLRHGYYRRRTLVPGTYQLETLRPQDIEAPGFWARFQDRDIRVMIVDVPVTDPLPRMNGFQLVHWGDHPSLAHPAAQPDGLLEEIRAVVGAPIRTDERQRSRGQDRRVLRQILRRVEQKGALCRHLMNKGRVDLAVVMFGDSHAAGHRYRKYLQEPVAPGARSDDLREAVRITYQAIDREIGRLVERFPQPSNVFVVSDSGLSDGYPTGAWMEAFCRQLGYQAMLEPMSAPGKVLTTFRNGLRKPFHLVHDRLAPQRQREPFGRGVDWGRTTAFAIPAHYTGYVRVNLKGREPLGVVEPGVEYMRLLDRLEADFLQLVDAVSGAPAVQRVTRTAQVFGGGPPPRLPDLVVDWQPSSRMVERIVHPKAVLVRRKVGDPRGNYHSDTGLVMAAGASIEKRGFAGDFSPLDFAPLFLTLMGEPAGKGPVGRATAAFMRRGEE
jgi:predicted AlkP superfamily phosphohydrolase/phosphomutase